MIHPAPSASRTGDPAVSSLSAVPYFAGLSQKVLETIASRCRPRIVSTGQLLFIEGDPCQDLCILVSGRVQFFRTTKTRLHLLDLAAVKKLIRQYPEIGLKLVTTAGEHMTHLVALADDLALKTVASRLAKHLDELAAMQAAGNHEGSLLPRARLREEELAALLGTVRVHISRSLRDLARAGAIEVNRRFIKIRDPAVLRQIARGK